MTEGYGTALPGSSWSCSDRACSLDGAWDAVSDYNAAMISPPWDEARLRRESEALLKRDIENLGPLLHAHEVPKPMTGPKLIPCSEDALAMEFVARHGPDWRHVATWGKWLQCPDVAEKAFPDPDRPRTDGRSNLTTHLIVRPVLVLDALMRRCSE